MRQAPPVLINFDRSDVKVSNGNRHVMCNGTFKKMSFDFVGIAVGSGERKRSGMQGPY